MYKQRGMTMTTPKKKPTLIHYPDNVKEELEKMSKETGISQTQLVVLATVSMLANYRMSGSLIFADLLNPDHKKYPVEEERLITKEKDEKTKY